MLDNYFISLSRRLLMIFIIFKILLAPMSGPQLLQQSKMNYTMQRTIIESGVKKFIRILCLNMFSFHFQDVC